MYIYTKITKCMDCGKPKSKIGYRCKTCSGVLRRSSKNVNWAGNNAKYTTIHHWLDNNYGKPSFCESCGTERAKRFEWANISGRYKRDRNDFLRMCTFCHREYDESMPHGKKAEKYFYKGIEDTITNWANYFGLKRTTLGMRLRQYNWTVEKALLTLVKGGY